MRTGKAAKLFGVTPETIKNWIDEHQLGEFFSESAKEDKANKARQRQLTEADLLVLNTIRIEREQYADNDVNWGAIGDVLRSGKRHLDFPLAAADVDTGTTPAAHLRQALETTMQRDAAMTLLQEKDKEIARLNERIIEVEREKDAIKERLLRELSRVESEKSKLIGELETELRLFREGRLTVPRSTEL